MGVRQLVVPPFVGVVHKARFGLRVQKAQRVRMDHLTREVVFAGIDQIDRDAAGLLGDVDEGSLGFMGSEALKKGDFHLTVI